MLNVVRHHLKKREEWPGHPPRDEGALLTVKIPTTKWLISSLKKKRTDQCKIEKSGPRISKGHLSP
jgi:hypothetical protein